MERRKLNVQNYGNSWLKPPGVPKTLYQQREEKREMEEHQEALRREQLAQELAEAEAEAAGMDEMMEGEGMGEEEARDLDDDIPDADNTGLSIVEDEDDDEENEPTGDTPGTQASTRAQAREEFHARANAAVAATAAVLARIPARVPDDVYREALARGEDPAPTGFGDDGASAIDEEAQEGMLQEEDLLHEEPEDLDMDADLDAEIPDADEASGYEHTDTEAELTSDDDESVDAGMLPVRRNGPTASMIRSDGTQTSMDLSSLISGGGSSQVGSSPRLTGVLGRRRMA